MSDALELLVIAGGWMLAAYMVGERCEETLLPRRTARPRVVGPDSALWQRTERSYTRRTSPAAAKRLTF